jgi:hypothetical protein
MFSVLGRSGDYYAGSSEAATKTALHWYRFPIERRSVGYRQRLDFIRRLPMDLQDSVVKELEQRGCEVVRRTSALVFLVHPESPGIMVRVGTVYVVAETSEAEIVRQRLDRFDAASFVSQLRAYETGRAR